MFKLLISFVAIAALVTTGGAAYVYHHGCPLSGCCTANAACCDAVEECCTDCCTPASPCCPDGACCEQDCCVEGAACCKAGAPCCGEKEKAPACCTEKK